MTKYILVYRFGVQSGFRVYTPDWRLEVNQFNDRICIHSILHYFIAVANELTSGTDVSRLSRANASQNRFPGPPRRDESRRRDDDVVGGASVAD